MRAIAPIEIVSSEVCRPGQVYVVPSDLYARFIDAVFRGDEDEKARVLRDMKDRARELCMVRLAKESP
jgi:hypothetical protein